MCLSSLSQVSQPLSLFPHSARVLNTYVGWTMMRTSKQCVKMAFVSSEALQSIRSDHNFPRAKSMPSIPTSPYAVGCQGPSHKLFTSSRDSWWCGLPEVWCSHLKDLGLHQSMMLAQELVVVLTPILVSLLKEHLCSLHHSNNILSVWSGIVTEKEAGECSLNCHSLLF
jgi:hypothetical protein